MLTDERGDEIWEQVMRHCLHSWETLTDEIRGLNSLFSFVQIVDILLPTFVSARDFAHF